MKIVYFTYDHVCKIKTGRELLSHLVWSALCLACPDNSRIFMIKKIKKSAASALALGLLGWLDGLSKRNSTEFISTINEIGATHVLIDGSNFGRLAREIKLALPQVRVITLFHNVEYLFFRSNFKRLFTVRSFGVMVCNYIAERMAVKWSDSILCLNLRDAQMLEGIYKKIFNRNGVEIFPLCIAENPSSSQVYLESPSRPRFALFVGGAFYANVEGVRWFARNVAGRINCETKIIGKGFEAYRDELECFKNVKVIGEVEDLGGWYKSASFVISPIFDGSGMKTKTAEAMQFGRPIFGTDEAFVGFEEFVSRVGFLCNDAPSFIDAINRFLLDDVERDPSLIRCVYAENYSIQAAHRRLRKILGV